MKAFLQDIRRSTIWWLTESKFAPTLQEQLVQEPHLRAAPNWSVFVGQTNQEALNLAMRSSQQMTEIWEQIDILSNGQIDWEEFDQTVEREIWEAAKSIRVGVQAPHVGSYCYRAANQSEADDLVNTLDPTATGLPACAMLMSGSMGWSGSVISTLVLRL